MSRSHTFAAALIAASLLSPACTQEGAAEYPSCIETRAVITLDEVTPLGYSAQSVLDASLGSYTNTADFYDGSTASITVDLAYEGGALYYVDSEPEPYDGEGPELAIAVQCLDFIQIASRLGIETDDGRLDEAAEINLLSYEEGRAQALLAREPAEIEGTLSPISSPAEWDDIRFSIATYFSAEGNVGQVSETASRTNDDDGDDGTAEARITEIAAWPQSL